MTAPVKVEIMRDLIQGDAAPHEVTLVGRDGTRFYIAEYETRELAQQHVRALRAALKPLGRGRVPR